MLLLLTLLTLSTIFTVKCHEKQAVPTFFHRTSPSGELLDRSSPDFDDQIQKPLGLTIDKSDESSYMKLWPNPIKNGELVSVLWRNIKSPNERDFIVHYCPYDDNPNHYLDLFHVTVSLTWNLGYGHHQVRVYNMRSECIFKYYRHTDKGTQLVAVSENLSFVGGSAAPLQGHIALTGYPDEMRILWNSAEVNTPPVVKYGLTKKLEMAEYEVSTRTYGINDMCTAPANTTGGFWHPGFIYDVVLKGLEPHTKYYYSYGTEGHMSEIRNFTTQIPPGDRTPFKFIVYGDMGTDSFPQAVTTSEQMMHELRENDIKLIFHNGDISYARGYAYIWEQWFHLIEPYATAVPYMIGIGNHEYDHRHGGEKDPSHAEGTGGFRPNWFNGGDDSGGECGVPMYNRFHMPDNGHSIWWYSFEVGLVHYIMISTEHDYSPNSPMYNWLENDLRTVNRKRTPWVIIAGHRAMYSSQSIASDYLVAVNMQRLFEHLLYKYNVDLAFWAHYHSYERTCKVYQNKCRDDGTIHVVVGSAGKSRDPDVWYKKEWSLVHIADYGYGRVTVANETHLGYEWINNRYDRVMDSVWLVK